jgi:outer membrane lipoprotein-sorting protein
MRTGTVVLAVALTLVCGRSSLAATDDLGTPGSWIDRMEKALWPAKTVSADVSLESSDEVGRGVDTRIKLARAQDDSRVRTQLRVIDPPESVGTVYEVTSVEGKPIERWVYLPAVRRLRNLIGTRRTDSFLGSEFTYEDLDIAAPRESEWKRVERVEETGGHPLMKVTSAPYSYYERVETLIDPTTALPVRVSFFDRAGELYKTESFGEMHTVAGHPMPTRIEMDDVQTGAKSVLQLSNVRLSEPIDENTFSESPIHKRRGK